MWSPWPWLIVMTSIRSKVLSSFGQAGLPSIHGSRSAVFAPRVTSLNVLWPSQVSANPRLSGISAPCGAGHRRALQLLEPRGEVAQHRRLVGDAEPPQPLTVTVELDHGFRHVAHVLGGVHAPWDREP